MGRLMILEGVVTIVQETRFWLRDDSGRGWLLTAAALDPEALAALRGTRIRAQVEGDPDARAVARRVEPCPPE